MNKHFAFGLIGVAIAATLIIVSLGMNQAEAPLVGDVDSNEPDVIEEAIGTSENVDVAPIDEPPAVPPPVSTNPPAARGCMVTGCSSQLCVEEGRDMATTCEWREQYACYQSATCERQSTGECGWTETPALEQCLVAAEGEMEIELRN